MRETIPFHRPTNLGTELAHLQKVLDGADWNNASLAETLLTEITGAKHALLTTSCTHALEMCALLLDIREGDEVIMPSFTFVSAANAFVLRGARIAFVDIDPGTMNVDPVKVQEAITSRTKAILVMHYGGVACDMKALQAISRTANIPLIEDAAHCIDSYYEGQHLGTFGDLGTLSFHYTKNIHCTEGGALLINNTDLLDRSVVLRDKGTNRKVFLDGQVDRYTWVDVGSSYTMGELNAAMLVAQLKQHQLITNLRREIWKKYDTAFRAILPPLHLPVVPEGALHNAHLYAIKCGDEQERKALQAYLRQNGIQAYFHYVPLHSSSAGKKFGYFHGADVFTTPTSNALLRLPLFTQMTEDEVMSVIDVVTTFYEKR